MFSSSIENGQFGGVSRGKKLQKMVSDTHKQDRPENKMGGKCGSEAWVTHGGFERCPLEKRAAFCA